MIDDLIFTAARCQAGWQSNKDTNGGQTSIIGNFESAEECAMRVYLEHPEAVGATWWTESAYTCEAIYGNTTVRDVILPFTHKVKTCIFKGIHRFIIYYHYKPILFQPICFITFLDYHKIFN